MTDTIDQTAPTSGTLDADLLALLGPDGFLTDQATCELHSSDLLETAGDCRGVIRPSSKEELSQASSQSFPRPKFRWRLVAAG